nr:MAG TPA: hypothetical protein [Caudoviricetes sp.]
MLKPANNMKAPKIQRLAVQDWQNGVVTAFDDGRTPLRGLRSSENLILDQDSVITNRPGTAKYGPQPKGMILGELAEFRSTTREGTVNWLACLQRINGKTRLCIARGEDETWKVVEGKDYHSTARGHFKQIRNNLLIMNGEDTLSYLDIANSKIVAFREIANPTKPTLDKNTGLDGTGFKAFYAVTFNSTVGETAGSPILQQSISTDRDMWNSEKHSLAIKRPDSTEAKSWNIYCGVGVDGGGDPTLYRLATALPMDQTTFVDNGSRSLDVSVPLPKDNNTAGPTATRAEVINGRVWLTGDKKNPFYVWRGGDYGHELDFSPGYGGGYTPVGNGTKEIPYAVAPYRDGKGDPKATVLSQGTNGTGKRFYITPTNITYGEETITVWQVQEDTGNDGTDSPDALVIYNNDLLYPSRGGFNTTGTLPQLQNVLSTRRITNTIQDAITNLNNKTMDKAVGVAFEGRVYWALPVAADYNNQIWVYDTDRKGAWMKPWNIRCDWMTLYNDNSGITHLLIVQGDKIVELSKGAKTVDDGKPFSTSALSGQLRFEETGRDWARVLRAIFIILRPQGRITVTATAKTEDGLQTFSETRYFGATSSRTGWSEPGVHWSTPRAGWSYVRTVPKNFNSASEEVELEIDEDAQWIQYGWSSSDPGVSYAMSRVVFEYVNIGTKDLS